MCSAVSEPTYAALVLASSRTLSPVDQEHLGLTGGFVQLDLEGIGIPLNQARDSHSILLDRHATPNLVPPRLAARLASSTATRVCQAGGFTVRHGSSPRFPADLRRSPAGSLDAVDVFRVFSGS